MHKNAKLTQKMHKIIRKMQRLTRVYEMINNELRGKTMNNIIYGLIHLS